MPSSTRCSGERKQGPVMWWPPVWLQGVLLWGMPGGRVPTMEVAITSAAVCLSAACRSRISRRVLAEQHLQLGTKRWESTGEGHLHQALYHVLHTDCRTGGDCAVMPTCGRRPGYVGILCTDLNVADAVDFAAQRTRQVGRVGCCRGRSQYEQPEQVLLLLVCARAGVHGDVWSCP
jgi:hypothetical protein